MTTPIKFVDLPPGAGKTEAAVTLMAQHIKGELKLARTPKYIFYVAASRDLMQQTEVRLIERVCPELKRPKNAPITWRAPVPARPDYRAAIRDVYSVSATDRTKVPQKLKNIFAGLTVDGKEPQHFGPGSILFLTHEAFLELPKENPIFADTLVLFDEARKWADIVKDVKLTDSVMALFDAMFERTQFIKGDGELHPSIHSLAPRDIAQNAKVSELRTKAAAESFTALDKLHTTLLAGRSQAYGFFQNTAKERKLVTIQLPSRPLAGFSDVYILSADFENSQMYHLLKLEGERVLRKSKWFMDTFSTVVGGHDAAMAAVQKRYSKLKIVPLLDDEGYASIAKYAGSGCILKSDDVETMSDFLIEHGFTVGDLYEGAGTAGNIAAATEMGSTRKMVIRARLDSIGATSHVLPWLMDGARKVISEFRAENEPAVKRKPLLFLNKAFADRLDYYDPQKTFQYLSHAKAEGNNKYRRLDAIVFLPAINPRTQLETLLNTLLSNTGYEAHNDYVVDRAIQCIGRGNIRNLKLDAPMLAVVSTRGLAKEIYKRYKGLPELCDDFIEETGAYTFWDGQAHMNRVRELKQQAIQKAAAAKAAEKAAEKAAITERVYTQAENKRLRSLRTMRRKAQDKGNHARIKTLDAQILQVTEYKEPYCYVTGKRILKSIAL